MVERHKLHEDNPDISFETMKRKLFLIALILTSFFSRPTAVVAQNVPFSSGIIPMCDTSYFTANVSGIGTL